MGLLFICIVLLFCWILNGCQKETAEPVPACADINGACLFARTEGRYFSVFDGKSWQKLTVKGVNLGTSLPGRWYTEFPSDRELYARWLDEIAAMNANAIRIYTLLDPSFYAVLAERNAIPENETLWLFQEIWPHDEVPDLNLHDQSYRDHYLLEIELVIDALHGNADIPSRPYRAYGNYTADVTPYLLGLMIGRELEPDEVQSTNEANPDIGPFEGSYVQNEAGASPTEAWLAEMCDYAANFSHAKYNRQYPVGFVSWPTLDPLTHLTEWDADGKIGYNDREVIDPNTFTVGPKNSAGFFGAYHIYPNYPDFMNNEPAFAEYSDEVGVFRYRGYLNRFMAIHPPYPALVAEFGISTSLNTAHINPEGLNHGGLSELDQGEMVVRMMRAILDENYAGSLIFEWSDEWAKKTWNTEPFMVPWERQVLWKNAMCPEQNYGLLAVEPLNRSHAELFKIRYETTEPDAYYSVSGEEEAFGRIDLVEAGIDEAFLYLALTLSRQTTKPAGGIPWERIGLAVGIETGMPGVGGARLPFAGLPELPGRVQFMLDIQSIDEAVLLVIPSYNRGLLQFDPQQSTDGVFEPISTLVNRERLTVDGLFFPALYSNESRLNYGVFDSEKEGFNSLAHWYEAENNKIIVRLPWMLLNIADPSSGMIIRDSRSFEDLPARDELNVEQSEYLRFYVITYSKEDEASPDWSDSPLRQVIDFSPRQGDSFNPVAGFYTWEGWEEPQYKFRLKKSYDIIADYFSTIP